MPCDGTCNLTFMYAIFPKESVPICIPKVCHKLTDKICHMQILISRSYNENS